MARTHPTHAFTHRSTMISSSPAFLHAVWITVVVAVCVALCTIHSRKSSSSSSSSARRSSRSASAHGSCTQREDAATPTPNGAAKTADHIVAHELQAAAAPPSSVAVDDAGPVTVIDMGTHGPIAPAFPAPDPAVAPVRRSLSAKHIRFAERLERIRSRRWGRGADEEAAATGVSRELEEDGTLWTKMIILGERCRVPSGGGDDGGGGGGDDITVRWKAYRPRRPRSVPVTRRNSFAGMDSRGGACS